MRHYLDYYFDLYWDLHVGVKGDAIPAEVRQIGESFNTVLAYRNPMEPIVYEHYMKVRAKLDFLKKWIADARRRRRDRRVQGSGQDVRPLLAQERRRRRALQPQGRRVRGVPQLRRAESVGKHDLRHHVAPQHRRRQRGRARRRSRKTMSNGGQFDAGGRIAVHTARPVRDGAVPHHLAQRRQSLRGRRRARFDVRRIALRQASREVRTTCLRRDAAHGDELRSAPVERIPRRSIPIATRPFRRARRSTTPSARRSGLPKCPFDVTTIKVADGRNVGITNSGFGTVFGVADGKPMPVCDHAGFAPFGFGYRRCPGEQLTIMVFEDFLRKVWKDKIQFANLTARRIRRRCRSARTR